MAKEYDGSSYDEAAVEQMAKEQLGLNSNPDGLQDEVYNELQGPNQNIPDTIEIEAPKKRRSGKNQREKAQLYQTVDYLAQELDQIKFENEQLRAQNAYKDRLTATYADDSLESKSEQAKQILKQAIEEGDIDRQVQAQDVISQLQAERLMVRQAAAQPKAPLPRYERPYVPSEMPAAAINEDYQEFLEENPWADTNSPYFDERLTAEADYLADFMISGLKVSGGVNNIGTKEFYDTIKHTIRSKYGLGGGNDYNAAPNVQRSRNANYRPKTISPVNNMNNPYNSTGYNPMSRSRNPADNLSQAQREIAHNLPLYDGQGKPKSDVEKRDHYAKALMADLQKQQQSNRR